jgi:ubiquinone biosynthesis protein
MFLMDLGRVFLLFRVALVLAFKLLRVRFGLFPAGYVSNPQMIRNALERMGVTYLKLGQYLATRFDLLPVELYREFTKLFEDASELDFEEVRAVIEEQLGVPLERNFVEFSSKPIASASIAQVHQARTIAGDRVAVKVQRPGLERIFESDFRNLRRVARLADKLHVLGTLSMLEVVDQFGTWSERELDFLVEARTAVRMAENATSNEIVPKVFPDLTTSKVLTMEFIEGVSLAKVAELLDRGRSDLVLARLPNLDFDRSGSNLAFAALHQLFVTGIFHGDPHPGNILIRDDNRVAFVDFGIFGELTAYERKTLTGYVENLSFGRIHEAFLCFERLTFPSGQTDRGKFAREGEDVFRRWYEASHDPESSPSNRHLGKYTAEIFNVVRKNHVRMTMDTLLFWRTLNALDSSAVRLSQHFDLVAQLRSFFEKIRPSLRARLVQAVVGQARSPETFETILSMPIYLQSALRAVDRKEPILSSGVESSRFRSQLNAETKQVATVVVAASVMIALRSHHVLASALFMGIALVLYIWT